MGKSRTVSGGDTRESAAEWVALDALTPWARNPRKNDEAAKKVAESIRRFGFGAPILARKADGEVIAGHTRLKAARLLGLKAVPVRYLDLDPAEAHLLALADNRLSEAAEWSGELASILSDYGLEDVALAGWDASDLEAMAAALLGDQGEGDSEGEDGPTPEPPKVPITKPGDVWTLGDHRLVCGDACDVAVLATALGGDVARLLHTDPPYGVDYQGGTKRRERLADDHRGTAIYGRFLAAVADHMDPKAAGYIWHAGAVSVPVLEAIGAAGYEVRAQIIWNKNLAQFGAIGAQYKQKHEPCFYIFRRGHAPYWFGPTNETTVWDVPRAAANEYHPTQKPVALPLRAMANSTASGDMVLDGFGGSGSTMVAAERSGRRCATVELSPAYCDVIVERWQNLTGGKATR